MFAATIVASCAEDTTTGPRIASLVAVSGGGQEATIGATLAQPLVIRVEDQTGQPVPGSTIYWAVVAGGGSINPSQSTTDAQGYAEASLRLGSSAGLNSVSATLGQLDPLIFTATAIPVNTSGNVAYLTVSAGSRHSCAVAQGGVAYCWGHNGDGQLGIGESAGGSGPVYALPQPTGLIGNLTFAQVSGGRYHNCSLTLAGVGYCWGINVDGRLGTGSNAAVTSPTAVVGTRAYTVISSGQAHSCSLDLAGRGFCWGSNSDGQLGVVGGAIITPDSLSISSPTAVQGGMFFQSISAGGLHACGVTVAGTGFCWGNNASGQLGDGSNAGAIAPREIGLALPLAAVSAGNLHTCAITNIGAAWCWGAGASGQLGNGGASASILPVAASGGQGFTSISSGKAHTCAVTAVGALFCWGSNAKGQIGDGTVTTRFVPTAVAAGLAWRSVSAGDTHTCAVTTGNVAYCWGDNEYGQLGDGSVVNRSVPTKVAFQP
jgi:alpha-tubulin suppressor-like RCC1 family protein